MTKLTQLEELIKQFGAFAIDYEDDVYSLYEWIGPDEFACVAKGCTLEEAISVLVRKKEILLYCR